MLSTGDSIVREQRKHTLPDLFRNGRMPPIATRSFLHRHFKVKYSMLFCFFNPFRKRLGTWENLVSRLVYTWSRSGSNSWSASWWTPASNPCTLKASTRSSSLSPICHANREEILILVNQMELFSYASVPIPKQVREGGPFWFQCFDFYWVHVEGQSA